MTVNIHEANSQKPYVYSSEEDVLQIHEGIINQLQYEKLFDATNQITYVEEMEKIHENLFDGGTHELTVESVHTDTFIGSLGISAIDNYSVLNTLSRFTEPLPAPAEIEIINN